VAEDAVAAFVFELVVVVGLLQLELKITKRAIRNAVLQNFISKLLRWYLVEQRQYSMRIGADGLISSTFLIDSTGEVAKRH